MGGQLDLTQRTPPPMHASRTFSPQRQSKVASRRSPQPVRNQAEQPLYEILESLEARVDLMEQMRQTRNLIQERARAPARGDDGVAFGEDACGVFLNGIDARDLCLQVPNNFCMASSNRSIPRRSCLSGMRNGLSCRSK